MKDINLIFRILLFWMKFDHGFRIFVQSMITSRYLCNTPTVDPTNDPSIHPTSITSVPTTIPTSYPIKEFAIYSSQDDVDLGIGCKTYAAVILANAVLFLIIY